MVSVTCSKSCSSVLPCSCWPDSPPGSMTVEPPVDLKAGFKEDWAPGGDPDWLEAHAELLALHREKSSTYGTKADPLANFSESAGFLGQAAEYPVLVRMFDKLSRALHMLEAGRANEVKEWPDLASLALCAEALRRRRTRV